MGWQIGIYNPNRSTLLRTLTPEAPGGLDAGFEWQRGPHGDCINLQLAGRNDTLGIPPRAVVTLTVDGVPQFHGVVPDAPSLGSQDAETVLVAGGVEALRVTLMDGTVYRNQGVYSIARDILSRLCPPALAYDATQIGDGSGTDAGPTLDTFYSPTAPLAPNGQQKGVLQALAESAKVPWGVDAQGRVFLGRPAAAPLAVAYAGQPWRRLPSQGREAVTEVVLRIVSAPSAGSLNASTIVGETEGRPYLPATISATATHPAHGTYNAQRSLESPPGVGLTTETTAGTITGVQMDTAPAVDGDPATGTTATGPRPGIVIANTTDRVIGLRLRYKFAPVDGAFGVVVIGHTTADVAYQSSVSWGLPESPGTREMVFIAPPSAEVVLGGWVFSQAQAYVIGPDGSTDPADFVVYDMALIVVNEAAAQRTAESYLQVPYASPAELTLPGLIPPSPTVSVTGSPDGDVTADAGLYVYKISAGDGRQTLVRLGSTGQDQTVRALKWAVRQ